MCDGKTTTKNRPTQPFVTQQRRTADSSLYESWRKARSGPDYEREIREGPISDNDDVRYRPLSMRLLLRLGQWMKPYRRLYIGGLIMAVLALVMQLAWPMLARMVVDLAVRVAGTPQAELGPHLAVLFWLAFLWMAAVVVGGIADGRKIAHTHRAGQAVVHDLRMALFNKLQDLSMSFFDRTKLGRIITRGTSDLQAMQRTLIDGLALMLTNTCLMIGAGLMILWVDWRLFLALFWLIPLIMYLNRRFRRRMGEQYQIVRAHFSRVASNLAENITGTRIVSAFNRQEENLDRFNELQAINTVNNLNAANIHGTYQPMLEFLKFAGQAIVLLMGGYLVATNSMEAGDVVAVFFYWQLFMTPTIIIGNFYNQLMMAMASSERLFSLMDMDPDIQDQPGARDLPDLRGEVDFRNVTFGYDPERPVLHDIDLHIPAGATVALVGATGSGKTSMLSLLARFYENQKGAIEVDGYDIRRHTVQSLRRQMGMVLQANYLFTGTIIDNIRYARPDMPEAAVYEAAHALGVDETFRALPNGYQTVVGERGAQISLGLRQLICFARVMLVDPRILLLDEATSAVDTVTEMQVQTALERLVRGRTTVIVAHRLSTITRADRIVVMAHGRIIEQGTHRELIQQDGHYAMMYRRFVSAEADSDT